MLSSVRTDQISNLNSNFETLLSLIVAASLKLEIGI